MLRLDAGRHPEDPALSSLIGDLSIHSEEFRHHWSANKVHQRTTGTKDYHHPLVGDLSITYQALTPGDDPDQTLFVYSTDPGSSSEAALQLLAGGELAGWELAGWELAEWEPASWEQSAPADGTARADHGS